MLLRLVKVSVYGVLHYYCEDQDAGHYLALLTGMKTLQPRHLEALGGLGFTLVIGEAVRRPEWVRARG